MSLVVSLLCWARPSSSLTLHPMMWNTWTHGALCWGCLWSWCNTGSSLCSYWGLSDPSTVSEGYHLPSWMALWSWSTLCAPEQMGWFLHCKVAGIISYMLPLSWLGLIWDMLEWQIVFLQHDAIFYPWECPYSIEKITMFFQYVLFCDG